MQTTFKYKVGDLTFGKINMAYTFLKKDMPMV